MPRVDIFVRVRDDSGQDNGHATFSLEPQIVNELSHHFTPERMAAYFGDLLRVQCMQVLYRVRTLPQDGISSVRTWGVAWEGMGDHVGEGVRDELVQQLRDAANNLRYVDPDEQIPSEFHVSDPDFARFIEGVYGAARTAGGRVMEQATERVEFVAETSEQFADRIREALPPVEGEGGERERDRALRDLNSRGVLSDRTMAELLAQPTQTLEEALNQVMGQRVMEGRDQILGRQQLGARLDDANFGMNTELPVSELNIPQDPERRQAWREAWTNVLTRAPTPREIQQREFLRGVQGQIASGIDPVQFVSHQRTRRPNRNQEGTQPTPKTHEDRASIPTRYKRKPVI